ncbi:MAG TPA: tryptophan synthase subunit beta, partial [Acidimicrobiia bacterium]|nr:tryptophan synthase subunit beta [Acidimicrobiia bacterium]
AALAAAGRATYVHCTDAQALEGFKLLSVSEGIVPALEPAHALGWLAEAAGSEIPAGATVLVTLSGRGDKDAHQVADLLGEPLE